MMEQPQQQEASEGAIQEADLLDQFPLYAPRFLKIQTMKGELVPLVLNTPQHFLEEIEADIIREGRLLRIIILKARREGVSTYYSGKHYQATSNNFNRYAATITHEPEATDTLFKMVKRFYDHAPVKPQKRFSNSDLLEFNNKEGTGLDSAFRVATAEKADFGSGQLIHYLHLSEVAKWPRSKEKSLLNSVLQCVPDVPYTRVVFESTAKGIGGEFHDHFWAARYVYEVYLDADHKPQLRKRINPKADPSNAFSSIFFPWFIFPDYKRPVPPDFKRTEQEEVLVTTYNLTDEHLVWRRWTIANKCGGSLMVFMQEYPSCAEEAFLVSGRPVFDQLKVKALKEAAPAPIMRYECQISNGAWIAKPEDGRLSVWEEPGAGRAYVIGADVAEGLEHGDFSTTDVLDQITGRQVAQFHGHIDPDLFGWVLYWLGKRYNNAWLGVERNNHGLTTVTTLFNAGYSRLYAEMVPDPPGKPRRRYGWLTTSATKPLIIDNLNAILREDGGAHGIKSAGTFSEMLTFCIQENGKMEANAGMCDDLVMSMAIAKWLRRVLPIPSMLNPGSGGARSAAPPSPKGWT